MRAVAGILLALSLFGLMFSVGPELALWFKSRSWQPAEATLLKVVSATKTQTGVTEVHYRYEARGGLHEGTRVFLSPRWMPGGEVLAEWEKRFVLAQQQGRVVRLWISPQNPSDAVFVRELNWAAMSPVLGGAGVGLLLGLAGLFWPARTAAETSTSVLPPVPPEASPAPPLLSSRPPPSSPQATCCTMEVKRADGSLCVELLGRPGELDRVESATLDRIDGQNIMRWQDALPLNVLANKTHWQVRCALPRQGQALTQAREHVQDGWQVTFRLRVKGQVIKVAQPLPAQWWVSGIA